MTISSPPLVKTVDIDALAEAFLAGIPAYIWDGESLPVPVEEIADSHAGLLVRDVADLQSAPGAPPALDGQGLSGLLLPQAGEIWVNADEARRWPARRRFTIAHELGHWQLHRGDQPAVFCRSTAIDPAATGDATSTPATTATSTSTATRGGRPRAGAARPADRPSPPPAEEQANAFGAAVLMPARLIRERYARQPRDFSGMCAAFGASGAAMGRRLHAVIPRATRD